MSTIFHHGITNIIHALSFLPLPCIIYYVLKHIWGLLTAAQAGVSQLQILLTRWLPGFARVPYYAPSPCHMHTVHNCHHIKSFHPPVKQYTTTHHNTEVKYFTCAIFFICNTKVSRARAALWVVLCNVYCILASVLIRVPPLKFPSLSPFLPRSSLYLSLAPLHPPSSARFLPPLFPSLRPCLVPFLPQPSLPSPAPTLPHIIDSSLPPLAPSILHPSSLFPRLPPSLPASLHPIQCTPWVCVCVFVKLHCIV